MLWILWIFSEKKSENVLASSLQDVESGRRVEGDLWRIELRVFHKRLGSEDVESIACLKKLCLAVVMSRL